MTYQQFDEKLQRTFEMNPEREQKARDRWVRLSSRGPIFHMLTRGSLLLLWMVACFLFFSWRFGTLHVIAEPGVWEAELGGMVVLSAVAPLTGYVISRNMVVSLDRRQARRTRLVQRRASS